MISNALAKIKASIHFGFIYLLCISCTCRGYNNQKLQYFLLKTKSYDLQNINIDLQIFLLAINSCQYVSVLA